MHHLVFVYGSLLRGKSNHCVLTQNGARFECAGRTAPRFTMRAFCEWFPAVAAGGMTAVVGEVYQVSDAGLAALDRLEGNGRLYTRRIERIGRRSAWVYLMPRNQLRGPVIDSGDWRAWRDERAKEARP